MKYLYLPLLLLLAVPAHATTIQCVAGTDIGPAINSAWQGGTPVELAGSSTQGNCIINTSLNGTGYVFPYLDGHGAQVSGGTGQYAVIDGTNSGFGIIRNLHLTSNGTNPSKVFLRLGPKDAGTGPGGICDSNVGQWTVDSVSFCMQAGCNQGLAGTGTIGLDIEMSEENRFNNVSWGQADTPIRIIGDMGGAAWPFPPTPSLYSSVCSARHSAIGNSFSGGQYAATQTSAVVLYGNGCCSPGQLGYGGGILSTVFDDGVLLSQPTNGILPGLPTAAITNNGRGLSEWAVIGPRVERFTSLWAGPLPTNSVFQAIPVPVQAGVPTPTASEVPTATPTPFPSASSTPTASPTPSVAPSPVPSETATATPCPVCPVCPTPVPTPAGCPPVGFPSLINPGEGPNVGLCCENPYNPPPAAPGQGQCYPAGGVPTPTPTDTPTAVPSPTPTPISCINAQGFYVCGTPIYCGDPACAGITKQTGLLHCQSGDVLNAGACIHPNGISPGVAGWACQDTC